MKIQINHLLEAYSSPANLPHKYLYSQGVQIQSKNKGEQSKGFKKISALQILQDLTNQRSQIECMPQENLEKLKQIVSHIQLRKTVGGKGLFAGIKKIVSKIQNLMTFQGKFTSSEIAEVLLKEIEEKIKKNSANVSSLSTLSPNRTQITTNPANDNEVLKNQENPPIEQLEGPKNQIKSPKDQSVSPVDNSAKNIPLEETINPDQPKTSPSFDQTSNPSATPPLTNTLPANANLKTEKWEEIVRNFVIFFLRPYINGEILETTDEKERLPLMEQLTTHLKSRNCDNIPQELINEVALDTYIHEAVRGFEIWTYKQVSLAADSMKLNGEMRYTILKDFEFEDKEESTAMREKELQRSLKKEFPKYSIPFDQIKAKIQVAKNYFDNAKAGESLLSTSLDEKIKNHYRQKQKEFFLSTNLSTNDTFYLSEKEVTKVNSSINSSLNDLNFKVIPDEENPEVAIVSLLDKPDRPLCITSVNAENKVLENYEYLLFFEDETGDLHRSYFPMNIGQIVKTERFKASLPVGWQECSLNSTLRYRGMQFFENKGDYYMINKVGVLTKVAKAVVDKAYQTALKIKNLK